MKRFLTAILSFIFLLSAVSCSIKGESSQATETTTTASLATSAVSRETTAATSETKPAPLDLTGRYMKKSIDSEGFGTDHFCMELISKDGRLGVLLKNDYRSGYFFDFFTTELEDKDGTVTAQYDGESVHFKLTSDGKTCDVVYQGGDMDGYLSGRYERQDLITEEYHEDAFPEAVNDPNTPNGAVDAVLAKTTRQQLGLPDDAVLTEDALSKVEELQVDEEKPVTLSGIEYYSGLKRLFIGMSYIKDISPLSKISSLEEVSISWSFVDTIPDLSNCGKLTSLSLTSCLIRDISPITKIRSLEFLNLSSNCITSIEPIKDVENISELNLYGNPITDWDSIKDRQSLTGVLTQDYDTTLLVLEKARQILKETITDDMSELEKEIAIYRKLQEHAHSEVFQRPMKPDGYYILMEGRGVCVDWADATALLMNLAGLECYKLISSVHAWNIIRIDGEYYEIDCSWDDEVEPINWQYFNLSRARMDTAPDHQVSDTFYGRSYLPVATHSMMQVEYLMLIDQLHADS